MSKGSKGRKSRTSAKNLPDITAEEVMSELDRLREELWDNILTTPEEAKAMGYYSVMDIAGDDGNRDATRQQLWRKFQRKRVERVAVRGDNGHVKYWYRLPVEDKG